ncbi:MAG: methionine aminopeptidase, type I [uncultured bacterium (gcode 4)]|uniref:Methionine aminopeptidase n=1 Tax=uncultured bacterium (gcode 4) TaxID=1234023 RepID=K2GIB5_9BACT|nr:MAG: methionine aminopeptidase, type I [uncultured bacterium (gcode 4)]
MLRNQINIKTNKDIEWIRAAWRIAAEALDMIWQYVKEWINTEELDHICNTFIMSRWGKSACKWYHWFPKYTCISLNDTICHWIPTKWEILKDWDILNIDITVMKDGYFGDTSRMYSVWTISPQAKKLIEVTQKALEIWIAQVYPGNMTGNIWHEISKYVESKWFSVVLEYTWHWIWRQMHEEPYIYHKAKPGSWIKIVSGMVFTIEPMINLWGSRTKILWDKWTVKTADWKLSAQFEHTIAVMPNWYEILTLA